MRLKQTAKILSLWNKGIQWSRYLLDVIIYFSNGTYFQLEHVLASRIMVPKDYTIVHVAVKKHMPIGSHSDPTSLRIGLDEYNY